METILRIIRRASASAEVITYVPKRNEHAAKEFDQQDQYDDDMDPGNVKIWFGGDFLLHPVPSTTLYISCGTRTLRIIPEPD